MFTTFSHSATTQENIAKVLGEKKYATLPKRKKILLEVMIKYMLSDPLGEYDVSIIRQILEKYKPPTTSPGHQLTSEASVKSKIKKYYTNYFQRRLPTDAEVNKIYKIFKETQELFQKNKSTHERVLLLFKIHFLKPTDDYQKNLQELSNLLFPTTQGSKQQQPKQDKQSKQEKVKSFVDSIRNLPKELFIEFVKHFIDDKAYDGSLSQLYETFSKKNKPQTQIGRQGSRSSGSRGVGGEISGKLFTLNRRSSSQR